MSPATHLTYCRICPAHCGLVLEVSDGVVTSVSGDREHPLTKGFTCAKGRRIGDFHSDPARLQTSQRRRSDATFEPVNVDTAVHEVADRLRSIIDDHGPDAVGLFVGTQTYTASLSYSFATAWQRAVGTRKRFTTVTIDQSAKIVATGRLGAWAGGLQRFQDADTWMLVGTNPLVSMQGGNMTGFPVHDNLRALTDARRRGLQLIVIDPRRSEVAAHADIHLQLRPGTDAPLLAGIHHAPPRDGLADDDFCHRWANGLEDLERVVADFPPEVAGRIAGVDPSEIIAAARTFGEANTGMATSGTGPDMGPFANVAEHLVQALNVVCGRLPREGDRPGGFNVLERTPSYRAAGRRSPATLGSSTREPVRCLVAPKRADVPTPARRDHAGRRRPHPSPRGGGRKPRCRLPRPGSHPRGTRGTRAPRRRRSLPHRNRRARRLRDRPDALARASGGPRGATATSTTSPSSSSPARCSNHPKARCTTGSSTFGSHRRWD
ncbi:MAG: molybdopterin-dependent oxidoreductase [Acidimicrobiales bacterium]|nr:molybdopterin-dependent oxidoreductase [Acidimicrobiales bacterium]